MSETPREASEVSPVGIDLHQPQFPYHAGHSSNSTSNTQVSIGPTEDAVAGAPRQNEKVLRLPQEVADIPDSRFSTSHGAQHIQNDTNAGPLPSLQKYATEQPRPRSRHTSSFSRDKKVDTAHTTPKLQRQATFTFDPYMSDSSDSSDDEQGLQTQRDGASTAASNRDRPSPSAHGPFSKFKISHDHFDTKGRISKRDGRLKLKFNETLNSGYFAKTLGAGLKNHFKLGAEDNDSNEENDHDIGQVAPEDDIMEDAGRRPKLNVVIIVIGSRGDIQPFLRIGKILKEKYGHRVRIATHPAFKKFVSEDSGLEFFSIGGDPSELMAFMVKNPGLLPSMDTIKEGEIGRRRAAMFEMFQGMWRACINSTDDEGDPANLKMMDNRFPFVADAIIANPPSFAPPHIAERLGIPLHMMFTFPYTPTVQFPHPLANVQASNIDPSYTNFMSYPLVEMMTWQGLGDLINRFRTKTLWLDEVSTLWAPGQLYRLKVPYTYMWSPGLVPKPKDWGPEIDVSGFVFLELASTFKPPNDLVKFLDAGPPPVYIGFGSIVVDDPDKFTQLIFEAVKKAGVRALVSKGWGGFGGKGDAPENVFMLENTPHDWLFPRVSAVVHHGGAGTTAMGLKCGKPTMIVPFFGDQPFWGGMVSKARAGAFECIPYKKLTADRLAEGIKQCLTDEARSNVKEIADSIAKEGDGALNAVRSFHRNLPLQGKQNMRCQLLTNRCATWNLKSTSLRLSPLAAELLIRWKKIKWTDLRLLRHYEWNDFGGPGEPLTGLGAAILTTLEDVFMGLGSVPFQMATSVKTREKYYRKRIELKKRQKHSNRTLTNSNLEHVAKANAKPTDSRPSAAQREPSSLSKLTEPEGWLVEEFASEAGSGVKETSKAVVKTPMNIMLAIAQGFHNAPRLYGDESVRRPPRITGFHSGVRAGRDEFMYGIYDGVTGLWLQPIQGAKDGGVLGCARGFGMGIGGLVLKDIAAFVGPPAYLMKGLNEESLKKHQPTNTIRRARIAQGQKELADLGPIAPRSDVELRRSATTSGHHDHSKDNDAPSETRGNTGDPQPYNATSKSRLQTEREVSEMWSALKSGIDKEKRSNRGGLKTLMPGYKKGNEGIAVPRKSTSQRPSADNERVLKNGTKKVNSPPLKEANRDGGASEGRETDDAPEQGSKNSKTTPHTALDFKEQAKKGEQGDGPIDSEKADLKNESLGHSHGQGCADGETLQKISTVA